LVFPNSLGFRWNNIAKCAKYKLKKKKGKKEREKGRKEKKRKEGGERKKKKKKLFTQSILKLFSGTKLFSELMIFYVE